MALKGVARLTDVHVCPVHGTNAITSGSSTINVNALPLARVGDTTACGATIVTGVSNFWGQQKKTAHLGSKTSHGGTITTASSDVLVNVSSFQSVIGGAKELINTFYKEQQEMFFEHIGMQPESVAELTRHVPLKLNGTEQEAGAAMVKTAASTGAVLAGITALGTKGRSILHDPKKIAEEFGEQAKEQFKQRQGLKTHPGYVDRYHGPDDVLKDKNGRLTELEVKGTLDPKSNPVPKKNKSGKQGSAANNKRRGKQISKKQAKVGLPSNRIGGPYTLQEVDLWTEIKDKDGAKQHLFLRANKSTNKAEAFKQDRFGELGDKIDEFDVNDF